MNQNFIHTVTEIIEKNLQNDDFSIEQLYQELNLSRTHLHRKIKAGTGLSTSLFIRKIRLERARQFLEESDHNISEIAYLTGHNSPQNFSKYFIKEFGVSPSVYRKEWKAANQKSNEVERLEPKTSKKVGRAILIIGSLLCIALILGFSIKQYWSQTQDKAFNSLESNTPTVAIIPFQNDGSDADAFLSEGIVEDILTRLGQFENLKVISKASTEQFKNAGENVQQIGAALQVNYLLEGSIQQEGTRLIINTELIRVSDGQVLWSERYNRPKKKLISIQAEVTENIAAALHQSFQPELLQKLEKGATKSTEAYTAMLRGRHLIRSRTLKDLLKSRDQFLMALEYDPSYSHAYEGLARVYQLLNNLGYNREQKAYYNDQVEKNVLKAIQFDQNNGKAYAVLANFYADQYRWEEAITAFEIALKINPNDAMINYWFSLTLRSTNDLERALRYNQIASERDPLHPVIHAGYIYTCGLAGEFDLADEILTKVTPILESSFLYYMVGGNLLLRKGDFKEAIAMSAKALELNPTFKSPESDQYYCLGKLGQKQKVLDYINALDKEQGINCLRAAKAFMGIEEKELALNALRKAADLGIIDDDLLVEPIFFSLREHPVYKSILEEYNLAQFSGDLPANLN